MSLRLTNKLANSVLADDNRPILGDSMDIDIRRICATEATAHGCEIASETKLVGRVVLYRMDKVTRIGKETFRSFAGWLGYDPMVRRFVTQ
jgi:hypothetical protein